MLDPAWSLVIASALAVIGGLIAYKQMVSHLAESSSEEEFLARRQQAYSRFFVKFLMFEAVPILFFLYGMYQIMGLETAESADVTLPLIAVLLIALFGLLSIYFTTSQILRDPRSTAAMRNYMTSMLMISASLVHSIPLVSFVIFLMVIMGMV
ncbi:MAG: hypothetical protein LOD87_11050 [Planifilum fulgidum]